MQIKLLTKRDFHSFCFTSLPFLLIELGGTKEQPDNKIYLLTYRCANWSKSMTAILVHHIRFFKLLAGELDKHYHSEQPGNSQPLQNKRSPISPNRCNVSTTTPSDRAGHAFRPEFCYCRVQISFLFQSVFSLIEKFRRINFFHKRGASVFWTRNSIVGD